MHLSCSIWEPPIPKSLLVPRPDLARHVVAVELAGHSADAVDLLASMQDCVDCVRPWSWSRK